MPKLQSIKAPGPRVQLVGSDGSAVDLDLTHDEYVELLRAMQWPEDLPAFDRFWSPINGSELGSPI
ncbi:MAG: hypothetical protein CGW95_06555 [Phenylobacterium zucineum]|nr:MAG: hypothetical protein CGW95_06555 [Phenylobacterium zucineum]